MQKVSQLNRVMFQGLLVNAAVVTSLFISGQGAHADTTADDTITMFSAEVEDPSDVFTYLQNVDLTPEIITMPRTDMSRNYNRNNLTSEVEIDKIVNLGKKVWEIIKANQPVVDLKFQFANALPKGVDSSSDLTGFSNLQSRSFRFWGKNAFGATVYDVTLTTVHQYGGQYEGSGQYLETVSVIPSNVSVLWGYTVNYQVDKVTAVNAGTAENPIAMISLGAKFKVETIIKKHETNTVYQFRGDSPLVQTIGLSN